MKKLEELCKEYMDHIESGEISESHLDDIQNEIFEAAMEQFYGKKVWKKINKALV